MNEREFESPQVDDRARAGDIDGELYVANIALMPSLRAFPASMRETKTWLLLPLGPGGVGNQ